MARAKKAAAKKRPVRKAAPKKAAAPAHPILRKRKLHYLKSKLN